MRLLKVALKPLNPPMMLLRMTVAVRNCAVGQFLVEIVEHEAALGAQHLAAFQACGAGWCHSCR